MNFTVRFITKNKKQMLIAALGRPGLDMLDAIREDYPELAEIKAGNINIYPECPIDGSGAEFKLAEDLARTSGLFKGRTFVEVQVPEHFFSRYVRCNINRHYEAFYVRDPFYIGSFRLRKAITKDVLSGASTNNTFDRDCLMKEWKEAGFPTDWS
jgi:hypothetical protein